MHCVVSCASSILFRALGKLSCAHRKLSCEHGQLLRAHEKVLRALGIVLGAHGKLSGVHQRLEDFFAHVPLGVLLVKLQDRNTFGIWEII